MEGPPSSPFGIVQAPTAIRPSTRKSAVPWTAALPLLNPRSSQGLTGCENILLPEISLEDPLWVDQPAAMRQLLMRALVVPIWRLMIQSSEYTLIMSSI